MNKLRMGGIVAILAEAMRHRATLAVWSRVLSTEEGIKAVSDAVVRQEDGSRPVDWQSARSAAASLLRECKVDDPPVPVVAMAEQAGLTVQFARFPTKSGNVSGFIDTGTCKVFVNADEAPVRQRFTVAHELGHWLLHREAVSDDRLYRVLMREPMDRRKKPPMEREADSFAANLLVPAYLLNRYWRDVPIRPSNASLARLFGVSEDVIRYRMSDLYGI